MNEVALSSISGAVSHNPIGISVPQGTYEDSKASVNLTILQGLDSSNDDASTVSLGDSALSSGLSLTAQQILQKINELLKKKLPDGVESLKPEDTTPEATAKKIVDGATAFYSVFAKQNKDLQGEDLLNAFLDTIKGGIDKGYGEAVSILEDLGAFSTEGVKSGVEETRRLIDVKLAEFEARKREELGLPPVEVGAKASEDTKNSILEQVGSSLSVIA